VSSAVNLCSTGESGWKPGHPNTGVAFQTHGVVLAVELRHWAGGETLDVRERTELCEEMGAVLEGRYELLCGDERYELAAGDGILVPPGEPRTWRVLSEAGVLYRVSCIGSAP
jgi:mannose-6-phosphate isomerase-like protein (cupin superfamily)